MIEVIHYQNEEYERPFVPVIARSYKEVRKILLNLPETIQIYFSNYGILEDTGVGGFAYASNIITISLDPHFDDKKRQMESIHPTLFHEVFHISQNFRVKVGHSLQLITLYMKEWQRFLKENMLVYLNFMVTIVNSQVIN